MGKSALVASVLRDRMRGRTQVSFSTELGVSQSTLSRILTGKRPAGTKAARRIAAVYPELGDLLGAAALETPTECRPLEAVS